MTQFQFIKDYKGIEQYRLSFNELAHRTFGIDFESWYQRGCWNDRYINYSFLHEHKVIANVSVNLMDIILDRQVYSAVQIGTVMTDPAYRNQGLSRRLMEIVIEKYRTSCNFMYLFANKSVLNFYSKFGFTQALEPTYSFDLKPVVTNIPIIRKLNIHSQEDWNLLLKLHSLRTPISSQCGVMNAEGIFTWYCLNVFSDDIYVLEDLSTVVIYQQEGHLLHLYDIVSAKEVRLSELVKLLPIQGMKFPKIAQA
ncbi:MAG: GNAT family N-acetyltransferase [Paenibacillaceae bacterium]